ncbi:MAG: SIMPL domain-containing protein, partial [Proteobacteria bacterium]|nr:SIMPL domain-containing protein [Pseudomonadota bacterium]
IMASFVFATTALAAENTPRTLTVQGMGSVSAPPDFAVVRSGVVTNAETPSEAITANSVEVSKMMATLRQFGIEDKDLQTSNFQLNPQYDRRGDNRRTPLLVGYQVTNQVTVRLRDIGKLGGLLDQLVRSGANQLGGISFSVANPEALLNGARKRAVADAKAQAKLFATELGVEVGKVLRISEPSISQPGPVRFRALESSASRDVPIAPGESTISARIAVVFEIE